MKMIKQARRQSKLRQAIDNMRVTGEATVDYHRDFRHLKIHVKQVVKSDRRHIHLFYKICGDVISTMAIGFDSEKPIVKIPARAILQLTNEYTPSSDFYVAPEFDNLRLSRKDAIDYWKSI